MADAVWSQEVELRSKDVNLHRRLRTSRLFELLQEASIAHTEELGWPRETTLDRGFLWMVALQRIEVARMPGLDDWIEREGARLAERARAMDAPQKIEWSRLDGIFRELVRG